VEEGITLVMTDSHSKLGPFLAKSNASQMEVLLVKISQKAQLELHRTLNNSYLINIHAPKIEAETNGSPALLLTNYFQEISLTFLREDTHLPIKQSRFELKNKIKLALFKSNITPSLLKASYEIFNLYKFCSCVASIKHKIVSQLSDTEFLLTNIIS